MNLNYSSQKGRITRRCMNPPVHQFDRTQPPEVHAHRFLISLLRDCKSLAKHLIIDHEPYINDVVIPCRRRYQRLKVFFTHA